MKFMSFFIYTLGYIYTKFPCKTHEEVDFYPKNLAMIDTLHKMEDSHN